MFGGNYKHKYNKTELRYFSAQQAGDGKKWNAVRMSVKFPPRIPTNVASRTAHNTTAYDDLSREKIKRRPNTTHSFDPVWVKLGYGICLKARCGGGE